jgi:hypothetical protein
MLIRTYSMAFPRCSNHVSPGEAKLKSSQFQNVGAFSPWVIPLQRLATTPDITGSATAATRIGQCLKSGPLDLTLLVEDRGPGLQRADPGCNGFDRDAIPRTFEEAARGPPQVALSSHVDLLEFKLLNCDQSKVPVLEGEGLIHG